MVHAIGTVHFIYICHKYLLHMPHSCLRQIDKTPLHFLPLYYRGFFCPHVLCSYQSSWNGHFNISLTELGSHVLQCREMRCLRFRETIIDSMTGYSTYM